MPKTESNSAAETNQPQVPQYVQYAPPYAQPFEDDTIDLYELWINFMEQKMARDWRDCGGSNRLSGFCLACSTNI